MSQLVPRTISAACGSPRILADATGETLPGTAKTPPIATIRFTLVANRGSRARARAMFVIGPRAIREISPGLLITVSTINSAAVRSKAARLDSGTHISPSPSSP